MQQLWLARQSLWIVAPLTSEGTAFQKYGDPGTWTVVDGKFFDIKYGS